MEKTIERIAESSELLSQIDEMFGRLIGCGEAAQLAAHSVWNVSPDLNDRTSRREQARIPPFPGVQVDRKAVSQDAVFLFVSVGQAD